MQKFDRFIYRLTFSLFYRNKFRSFKDGSKIDSPCLISGFNDIEIGKETIILANSRIQNFYLDGKEPSIKIGNRCYICYYFTLLNASKVEIGNNVLIASHVLITSENHSMNPMSNTPYMDQPLTSAPVVIGDGCWIGEKTCILPGVFIGKKCIIGAGSVVTKSIPDYCIAVGNPARVIKKYNFNTKNWENI